MDTGPEGEAHSRRLGSPRTAECPGVELGHPRSSDIDLFGYPQGMLSYQNLVSCFRLISP
jgi:hypothetical protein